VTASAEVDVAQPRRVGEHVDRDDPAVRERAAGDGERAPAGGRDDDAGGAVDERRAREAGEARAERRRLLGDGRDALDARTPNGSSRRALRARSMSMQIRPTTVVSQPPRFSTAAPSERLRRSHASCTASSASPAEPSIR
jgi:hypothetical protein